VPDSLITIGLVHAATNPYTLGLEVPADMKHVVRSFLFVAFAVLSVSVAEDGKDAPKKAEDTWERQKECLKLAEADIARNHTAAVYKDTIEWSWSAHYSPKYGHCYVQIHSLGMNSVKRGYSSTVLRDALENTLVAATTEQEEADRLGLPGLCHFPGKNHAPCAESEAFITDHMTN
jgi:hypothetical protein